MIDCHIHTTFSPDGGTSLEDYVVRAIELGGKIVGFSEHIDFDYDDFNLFMIKTNYPQAFLELDRVKELYKNKITVLKGMEVGYGLKSSQEKGEYIAKSYNVDYVINSVHLIDGEDCWVAKYYEDKCRKKAYNKYLDVVLRSLNTACNYEILGHIGYIMRKAPYENKAIDFSESGDYIDAIFKKSIELGKSVEINTNTRGVAEHLPPKDMLIRYRELGGELITISSDSHTKDRLYDRYDEIKQYVKSLGFNHTCYYVGRKIQFEKI